LVSGDTLIEKLVKLYLDQHAFTFIFQVDMSRVKLEVIKPWITTRISDLLGMEDDVLVEFVSNQLEADNVRKTLLALYAVS
jgi:serine/arginine repetitive matrix protein 1